MQPNEVAAPLFWKAASIDSPAPHIPRKFAKKKGSMSEICEKKKKSCLGGGERDVGVFT